MGMNLKIVFSLACCLVLAACGDDNKGSASAEGAIGSWELTKIVGPQGQSIDVKKPAMDSDDDTYHQLIITKEKLQLVSTDTVTVSIWSLPVQFNGSRIITVDNESVKMPDYEIVSNTGSSLTYRMTDDDNGGYQAITFIARRIPDDQTALQKALMFTEPQSMEVAVPGLLNAKIDVGILDPETDDLRRVRCTYEKNDDSLVISYLKMEKTEGGFSFGSTSDSIQFRVPLAQSSGLSELATQASSLSTTVTGQLEHVLLEKTQWKSYGDNGCTTKIEKIGPKIKIEASCQSKDAAKKSSPLTLKANCLLRKLIF